MTIIYAIEFIEACFHGKQMKIINVSAIFICMTKEERQRLIIAAVKSVVAQKGMNGFSIRQVAELTGINEALIYRDFYTKDNLLFACYESVEDSVSLIYEKIDPLALETPEQTVLALKEMWMRSFCYLLKNKDDTLFIRSYRESSYRQKLLEAGRNREPKYFFDARDKFVMILPPNINVHFTWIYLIDIGIEFAVKILKKELPDTEESINTIWNLVYHGISATLKEN